MLVQVGRGRDGAGEGRALDIDGRGRVLVDVGMVSAEDGAAWLGGCWRPLGGRRVRHSADLGGSSGKRGCELGGRGHYKEELGFMSG